MRFYSKGCVCKFWINIRLKGYINQTGMFSAMIRLRTGVVSGGRLPDGDWSIISSLHPYSVSANIIKWETQVICVWVNGLRLRNQFKVRIHNYEWSVNAMDQASYPRSFVNPVQHLVNNGEDYWCGMGWSIVWWLLAIYLLNRYIWC